jgi:hypothetical protein
VACLVIGPLVDAYGFVVMYPLALVATAASYGAIYVYARGQVNSATNESGEPKCHRRRNYATLPSKHSSVINDEPIDATYDHESFPVSTKRFSTSEIVCILLASIYNIGFFISALLLSSGTAVVENLIFLFFEDLGGSNTMCGITVALTVMFEIPIFHIAPTLLKKFGPGALLQVANFAYVTRVLGYTFIPPGHASYVILLEPLHGVTFACFQSSAVELIAQIMPTGYEATGQGLWALWKGIGSVAGLLIGGLSEDRLGARTMYRIFALNVTIGIAIFGVLAKVQRPSFEGVPADSPDFAESEQPKQQVTIDAQLEMTNIKSASV